MHWANSGIALSPESYKSCSKWSLTQLPVADAKRNNEHFYAVCGQFTLHYSTNLKLLYMQDPSRIKKYNCLLL